MWVFCCLMIFLCQADEHYTSGYYNTDGLGLLEYLYWCEDVNMVPIMGVYAGYSLDGSSVPQASLQPYIDLAINQVRNCTTLDLMMELLIVVKIHFAISDASTNQWAALRAKNGRTAPFKVDYIEIGNEDFIGNAPGTYASYRWKAFHDAILAVFPNLKIIATTNYNSPVLSPTPKYCAFMSSLSLFHALIVALV
jgi:alpha-L-arabinofuranosidase